MSRSRSKQTIRQIEALKTFLSVDKPIGKRAAMYRLLSMGLLPSTKRFHSFGMTMNKILAEESPNDYLLLDSDHFDDECFVDNRSIHSKRTTWKDLPDFKAYTARVYHRDPWQEQPERVEVWIEKQTLIPLIEDVTYGLDVTLMASPGGYSRTFLYQAAKRLKLIEGSFTILYIGDFDPGGLDIERSARERLKGFLDHDNFTWVRLGVTEDDYRSIAERARVDLKKDDPNKPAFLARYDNYGVEVEALEVAEVGGVARRLEGAIRERIDDRRWQKSLKSELREKKQLAEGAA